MVAVSRELSPVESAAFGRMLRVVRQKANRNRLRTSYFEAKRKLDKVGFSIPPHMTDLQTVIGWPAKAVKVPARRIRPDGFTSTVESSLMDDLDGVFTDHVVAVERMAVEAALQHSASFVFTTPGDESLGEPAVIPVARTALEATAEVDARSGRVTAALESISATEALLYAPRVTVRVVAGRGEWRVTDEYETFTDRVLCTPYVWDRSLSRPFGSSRITRPLMGYTDMAVRTMLRQEVNAEFYSSPQRALMGAYEEHFTDPKTGKRISPWDALIGGVWGVPDVLDEETGELQRAKLEQLSQATMQPHSEMLRTIGLMVSSETSIPVSYLGIVHDNPASADAIRANEADMCAVIEGELPSIGASRTDLARNCLTVLHGGWTPSMEKDLRGLHSRFLDPGTVTKSMQADAGIKFGQAFPEADPEVKMEVYGLDRTQIERMLAHEGKRAAGSLVSNLLAARQQQQPAVVAPVGEGAA